jgi:hypothetical protein
VSLGDASREPAHAPREFGRSKHLDVGALAQDPRRKPAGDDLAPLYDHGTAGLALGLLVPARHPLGGGAT